MRKGLRSTYIRMNIHVEIWRGFVHGFVNYKYGALDSQPQVIKVYQLLAHGRWFSPGTQLLSPLNWSSWYSWNIAESGVKHQTSNQVVVAVDFEQTRINFGKKGIQIFFFQGKIHRWDASAEDECEPFANIVQRVRILFCTPQSLCNYLDELAKMKVSLNDFSLIVLDECHHTIGKGPFNEIMSYYRRHKYGPQSNRIPQVFLWNLHKIKTSPQSNRIPQVFHSNLHKIKTSPQSNRIPQVWQMSFKFT